MEQELKSREYYEQRINFVAKQYLHGKINYQDVANPENRFRLINLLNNSTRVDKNIEETLSFQILNDLLIKN
jgi:hypothetical protein